MFDGGVCVGEEGGAQWYFCWKYEQKYFADFKTFDYLGNVYLNIDIMLSDFLA